MAWSDIFPFMGVSIRCGDLTLSAMTPDDVPALLAVAGRGIVPDGSGYPFLTDWALLPKDQRELSSTQFYFSRWSTAHPGRFELLMVARQGDRVLGAQDLRAADFAVRRTGSTGSWLGREFHGRGIGTRMRQMICAFAFDELGAVEMRTEAYADNPASNRVSQKTGYREFDRARVNRLGEAATEVRYKLTREQLTRPEEPISHGGGQALRRFLGISWVSPR
ncbi:GNAT family N-acetyltransferase [Tessaracoccus sp. Y36]